MSKSLSGLTASSLHPAFSPQESNPIETPSAQTSSTITKLAGSSKTDHVSQAKPGQGAGSTMSLLLRQNPIRPAKSSGMAQANASGLDKMQFARHHFKSGKTFTAQPDKATVIGEGPAGLQCVLSLLDKAKENPEESAKQIIWYKARDERVRRHIVTVNDKTMSIRSIENSLQDRIDQHEMHHLLIEKHEKFDYEKSPAAEAKHVFLADGYNSNSRTNIFFGGEFQKPKTSLVERCIVCYTGLQPIDAEQADTGTKTPMSLSALKKSGIKKPEEFIDLMKISFAGLIDLNKQQRAQDSSLQKFDPYLNGFKDIRGFKTQVGDGLNAFFKQHGSPQALKTALAAFELSAQGVDKYSRPEALQALCKDFEKNLDKFADAVKTEKGEIIFVPVYRKHSYFGMKGLSAKDDDTGQTFHLVGDAAMGFAPGGPNISEAMKYSEKIVQMIMDAEFKEGQIKPLDKRNSSLTQKQWTLLSYKEWNEKKSLLSVLPTVSSIG
ncbi:MAG: hypothetical protein ACRYGK_19345 [Janthinobacterium lividum]